MVIKFLLYMVEEVLKKNGLYDQVMAALKEIEYASI